MARHTLNGLSPADLPLYGLKHLFDMGTAAIDSIIITEGEKSADALIKIGYAAVGTVTGASSCPNQEVFAPLVGFEARKYVWPDNDDAGRLSHGQGCPSPQGYTHPTSPHHLERRPTQGRRL